MDKTKFTKFFKDIQNGMSKHSPEILTGIGIAGMITTTILAVKATPKALELIEEKKRDMVREKGADPDDKLPVIETVKAVWKPYVPAAVTCAASTACLIGANSVNMKRITALSTAYKLSETALTEYKEKVIETVGAKKEKVIREKVVQDKIDQNPVSKTEVIVTGKGTTLFCEPVSMRYFELDIESLRKVINDLNYRMVTGCEEYISLSDFYDAIGLAHTKTSDDIGWNIGKDGPIEMEWIPAVSDDGQPCFMLEYHIAPRYDYTKLM